MQNLYCRFLINTDLPVKLLFSPDKCILHYIISNDYFFFIDLLSIYAWLRDNDINHTACHCATYMMFTMFKNKKNNNNKNK